MLEIGNTEENGAVAVRIGRCLETRSLVWMAVHAMSSFRDVSVSNFEVSSLPIR